MRLRIVKIHGYLLYLNLKPQHGGANMDAHTHNQETIIRSINQIFADLLSAQTEGNITDEYKDSVSEALRKAYNEAIKNYPGNKRS